VSNIPGAKKNQSLVKKYKKPAFQKIVLLKKLQDFLANECPNQRDLNHTGESFKGKQSTHQRIKST